MCTPGENQSNAAACGSARRLRSADALLNVSAAA